jgi:hypothetical protein
MVKIEKGSGNKSSFIGTILQLFNKMQQAFRWGQLRQRDYGVSVERKAENVLGFCPSSVRVVPPTVRGRSLDA